MDSEIEITTVSEQTCTTAHIVTYTASVVFEDVTYTEKAENVKLAEMLGHDWQWTVDTEPTCGATGLKHEKCSRCDATRNLNTSIPATGNHTWEWVIDTEATCGATGKKHEKCSVCGATQSMNTVIPATGEHTEGETVRENVIAATCTAPETWDDVVYCAVCGTELSREAKTGEISAEAHTWGAWTVQTPATCETAGTEVRVCANDPSHKQTREIPAIGGNHLWSEWQVTKPATCKEDGVLARICAVCALQEEQAISSSSVAHKYGKWVVTKAATCTENGKKICTCSVCGKTKSKTIKATGHSWGEWTSDAGSPASCTSGGKQIHVCEKCGTTERREVEGGLGHVYSRLNYRGEGYCDRCGQFHCSYCDTYEAQKDAAVIGVFIRIIHVFIHFAHSISYPGTIG